MVLGALHVAATLALVPYVALAVAFALLRDAIAAGSLLAMFLRAVDHGGHRVRRMAGLVRGGTEGLIGSSIRHG